MRKPVIGIPMGDPSGIGPEIALKAQLNPEIGYCCVPVLIGPRKVAEDALSRFRIPLRMVEVREESGPDIFGSPTKPFQPVPGQVLLLDTGAFDMDMLHFGSVQAASGHAAYLAVERAAAEAMIGRIDAIATAPINKEALRAAGIGDIGHTEMLGRMSGIPEPLTLFQTRELRIFFLTRHVSLHDACGLVTKERVVRVGRSCITAMKQLGMTSFRLAIAGLNPHAGEHGLFGNEEEMALVPAVHTLQEEGHAVFGPLPADSVFHQASLGKYDAVLSLYHDQGHIAAKMHDFERTISLTLGLPFLRTSVDHGTAFDVAGRGIASSVSMEEAIFVAARYAHSYRKTVD